jgi:hypothetical protein
MPLTKAIIEVDARDADASRGLPRRIEVQFNPTEYTLNKGAQIAEIAIPGIDSPILQFIRGQNEKLTLDLFFDTTGDRGMGANARDVRELTRSIYQLVKIQPKTHAPPRLTFSWGQGLSFKAIVESVQQKFTLFNPEGIPLRATLSVTFREYKTLEQQISEMNLQSSEHTKRREVQQGETLSAIAYQEYRDAQAWRHIANANPAVVINPRRLIPGTVLEIPPLDVFGIPTVRRT